MRRARTLLKDGHFKRTFFSPLKVELIYAEQYTSVAEVKSGIFEFIEIFYDRLRRHSANGYISPVEFERVTASAAS